MPTTAYAVKEGKVDLLSQKYPTPPLPKRVLNAIIRYPRIETIKWALRYDATAGVGLTTLAIRTAQLPFLETLGKIVSPDQHTGHSMPVLLPNQELIAHNLMLECAIDCDNYNAISYIRDKHLHAPDWKSHVTLWEKSVYKNDPKLLDAVFGKDVLLSETIGCHVMLEAAKAHKIHAIVWLLRHHVWLSTPVSKDKTLLDALEEAGLIETLEAALRLLPKDELAHYLNMSNEASETLLHIAVEKRNESRVQWLLKHGVPYNTLQAVTGETPLYRAAEQDSYSIAKCLLEYVKDPSQRLRYVNQANVRGATPLFKALQNENVELARLLIGNGARVVEPEGKNVVNATRHVDGLTPLHVAAGKANAELMKILLAAIKHPIARKWAVNQPNTYGYTPLHYALAIQDAPEKRLAAVKVLLKAGASPNVSTQEGISPLHMAVGCFLGNEKRMPDVSLTKLLLNYEAVPLIQPKELGVPSPLEHIQMCLKNPCPPSFLEAYLSIERLLNTSHPYEPFKAVPHTQSERIQAKDTKMPKHTPRRATRPLDTQSMHR